MKTKIIKLITPFETIYLTAYNRDLIINEQIYKASLLVNMIDIERSTSVLPDTLQMSMIQVKNQQIQGGIIEVYDYDLQTNQMIIPAYFYGKITEIHTYDKTITISASSTKILLQKIITRTYGRNCAAQWGDNRCGIDKTLHKELIEITNINNNVIDYTILSGLINNFYNPYLSDSLGHIIPLIYHDSVNHTFQAESFCYFQIGTQYELYAGCRNIINDCQAYNNKMNYLGFTH